MPFDEEKEIEIEAKTGIKKVSSQKSIFESTPKKPSMKDLNEAVQKIEENNIGYKKRAAELSLAFKKMVNDKTLNQNKTVFMQETEQELLVNMIKLASQINNDPNEQEGIGSLMWVTLLFKTCLSQRDRINNLEYATSKLEKNISIEFLKPLILKEIQAELDKQKNGE
jgi:hypothetical protein